MTEPAELERRRDREERVRRVLASLADLSPDRALTLAMPDEVWDRLQGIIQTEGDRPPTRGTVVIRRRLAWLAAAAVCVVVAGVGVQTHESGTMGAVAAGSAELGDESLAPSAEAGVGARSTVARVADGAAPGVDAGVAPSRRVLASGTAYGAATLGSQVEELLQSLGVRSVADVATLDQQQGDLPVGVDGFTSSTTGMTACLTGLTGRVDAQAVLIDRARFMQADVGVIVMARGDSPGAVDIWVVRPACSAADPSIVVHRPHVLRLMSR